MNSSGWVLLGLTMQILGVGFLIRDECGPLAARIRQSAGKLPGNIFAQTAFLLAKIFGSSDVRDQENYAAESFSIRFYGFCLIWLGFLIQAIVVVGELKNP